MGFSFLFNLSAERNCFGRVLALEGNILHRGFLQAVKLSKFLDHAMQCSSAQIIALMSLLFGNAKQTNAAAGQWRGV
jgi:hypothetical protein